MQKSIPHKLPQINLQQISYFMLKYNKELMPNYWEIMQQGKDKLIGNWIKGYDRHHRREKLNSLKT